MKKKRHIMIEILPALVLLFLVAVFVGVITYMSWHSKDADLRSFVAQQYSFSESECGAVDNQGYQWCLTNYDHRYPQDVRACKEHCSLYCHAAQIQNGTSCHPSPTEGWWSCNNDEPNCIRWVHINDTICTPTYQNITTFCATPEQISAARSLAG
jgi:hypothetical protein